MALLLAVCAIGIALVPLHGTYAAVALVVLVTTLAPGLGALVALPRPPPNAASYVALVSASWSVLVAAGCAWTTWQDPVGTYLLLAAPALVGALVGLRRGARPAGRPLLGDRVRESLAGLRGPRVVLGWGLATTGLVAWAASVAGAVDQPVGDYGLLPVLGPWFVTAVAAGIALVALGCLVRPASAVLAGTGLVLVGGIFSVTPALLTTNFLGPVVYKHLGLVDLIVHQQPLADPKDVLQQWPGFYALGASVQTVSGVEPLHYANGAGPLFTALAGLGLFQAVRTATRSAPVAATATLVFLCSMWVGQIYYGAQSLGYAMVLLSHALLVPVLQSMPPPRGPWGTRRLVRWSLRGAPEPRPLPTGAAPVLAAGLTLGVVALVVTHQLSPYILVLQLAPFLVTGWVRGRWRLLLTVLCALPFAWLLLHYQVLGSNNVFSGLSLSNVSSQVTWQTSPAQQLAARCARIIGVVVWGGSVVSVLSYARRRPGHVLLPAVLAFAPALILAVGNYGGEAIYRVWIFTAPWCAALVAIRITELRRTRRVAVVATAVACVGGLLGSAQATSYGMWRLDVVDDDHVQAARWLDTGTPPGSLIVGALSNFPSRISRGYAERNPTESVNDPAMSEYPDIVDLLRSPDWTDDSFSDLFQHEFGDGAYLVVAQSMAEQNRYYRILPLDTTDRLRQTVGGSRRWVRVYQNPEVAVYRFLG